MAGYADSKRYYDWLDRAGEDLISAGILMKNDNCYNAAAFHCQQTIEKALKSYILLKSGTLVDGHNLTWLCKRAMKYDDSFASWLENSAFLNRCYIETRYPADIPLNLEYRAIKAYYKTARDMYRFICEEMDIALDLHKIHPKQRSL
jgi:HEPN domain-containing protein